MEARTRRITSEAEATKTEGSIVVKVEATVRGITVEAEMIEGSIIVEVEAAGG